MKKVANQQTMTDTREIPPTEGIKYAGSKLRLLPHILELAARTGARTVLDGFAGTTRVSQAFARSGYRVVANDISVWSRTFGICYLKNRKGRAHYRQLIEHLNDLPPRDGWFTEHYGGLPGADGRSTGADGLKKPFQVRNTRKLDAIRAEIDALGLSETERCVLLTSLILALDRVDSTLGHYASYLSEWSPRSYAELELRVPRLFRSEEEHEVRQGDIFETLAGTEADLAYFDPPYGSNNEKMPPSRVRYAAYYHLWTSVVLNDRPETFGRANRRRDSSDTRAGSVFEDFRRNGRGRFVATEAIERLLRETRARHVILSYSSGGRATAGELFEILEGAGRIVDFVRVDHRRNVMASMRWTNDWVRQAEGKNREFLFLLEKR